MLLRRTSRRLLDEISIVLRSKIFGILASLVDATSHVASLLCIAGFDLARSLAVLYLRQGSQENY